MNEENINSQLLTIKKAAQEIGIQYRQLLDAVNEGTVPHYRLRKSRKLVSIPEIIEIMKNNEGGL